MHLLHKEILDILMENIDPAPLGFNVSKYLGSPNTYLNISTKEKRRIAKTWARSHKDISSKDFFTLLDSLNKGKSFQEKSIVADLLVAFPQHRKTMDLFRLTSWLDNTTGWGEVDSLCQSTFTAEEILEQWNTWKELLITLARDINVNKRRASLVLLTKAVGKNEDPRLKHLAFSHIKLLMHERDILITKAVSWLLRNLIKFHRQDVSEFLKVYKDDIPKIAFREAKTKLATGKKYVKK